MTTSTAPVGVTPVRGRSPTARLLAAPAADLAAHVTTHGPLPVLGGPQLVALLEASGLAGRGGAGFPTWRKLADVPATATGSTVVVANGAEGEPASSKDAVLLADAPHLVLDGLVLAGTALGARELHLYAGAHALHAVRTALTERPGLRVTLTEAPDTFISGEESAVVRALAGGPAVPHDRTTRITRRGLGGAPTLVQNVETLAHLALAARHGAAWFRTVGPTDDPGTRLVTLSGDVAHPGVLEVASGTNLAALLRDAGTDPTTVRAVLVGGYHGAWVPGPELSRTELSVASLHRFGATPGAGVVHVLGVHRCGLTAAAEIATWLGEQSARQCGPCVNGLPTMAATLTRLARRSPDPELPREITRLAALVTGRGSCRHPDGTARMVASTLRAFGHDVSLHRQGRCEATPGQRR
ncbi:NADH-quinone oxidoreductase subunit F [Rhodococcus antarcticus]|jgi:NADH:ubiquinone oxidoreductase subunit F (NADH-binding)|uniref:NADH-quinone oxidoreductase subunit F n=1 Tax=Rhodococcus antarcticus TaxID=2987751 RepID=A0ABY6P464_9NOCA|nr:NADH-ubiquinone oxidoreductase-F iron-sulfur binding region domain-containing protein [Rhodococcus antarcticus]UZJ26459.1 NADH-quinone oxidoreductase subunit F [Rhodococcus antarcticus]